MVSFVLILGNIFCSVLHLTKEHKRGDDPFRLPVFVFSYLIIHSYSYIFSLTTYTFILCICFRQMMRYVNQSVSYGKHITFFVNCRQEYLISFPFLHCLSVKYFNAFSFIISFKMIENLCFLPGRV
jgi:hypothetical protein